ncbi:RICIN domain-containing protein [Streptomyces sp. NPDC059352]|uniref:glycosyl hydrolase family 95 catalytic domain-containing protein n=1 Tax=Streptomyces sp. NPDC059352 TaxID=3346810 RepID=UPI0036A4341B
MSSPDTPLGRRGFIAAAALSAGAVVLPGGIPAPAAVAVVPPQVTPPQRGMYDTVPASDWTDGFVTGNGEYGAVLHGTPQLGRMVLNHHRFLLPNGTRDVTPPVLADRLESVRNRALAGDYRGAAGEFAEGWDLRWTQTFHPGYELQLSMPGATTRKTVDATVRVSTALEGVTGDVGFTTIATASNGTGYLNLRGTYPSGQGAFGYEGVTRVVVTGGKASVSVRQNGNRWTVDIALPERMYDSGRYLFVSSSGILPPRLTGLWEGSWNGAWADDFTTDANVNLQIAGGNILGHGNAMDGFFDLVLGQLDDWRRNAANLYGTRGFPAPSRTDDEHGHMLSFNGGDFPGQCWTGGADWMLYPLLECCQVTGDAAFLRDKLGPALMELALFYEDFLTRTDSNGKVVFVPSFSLENPLSNTGQMLSTNATGDIMAGRHALQAAIDAANTLNVEQGSGQGVARWTALPAKLPDYAVNGDDALAEWSWPGLNDRYNHRHVQHLYGAWPLHEINPEEKPELVFSACKALRMRGDENYSAPRQPPPCPGVVPPEGRRGRLRQHPQGPRQQHGLPLPGDLPQPRPAHPQHRRRQLAAGDHRRVPPPHPAGPPGDPARPVRSAGPGNDPRRPGPQPRPRREPDLGHRNPHRHRHPRLGHHPDSRLRLPPRITSLSTTASVAVSPLGDHARKLFLTAGTRTQVTVGVTFRVVNRASGKVLDSPGASTTHGEPLDQWTDTDAPNHRWKLVPAGTSDHHYLVNGASGPRAAVENGSTNDCARIVQMPADSSAGQEWTIVPL